MPEERVYKVAGAKASPLIPITLGEAGLSERSHLQEWVIEHPQMLGDGVRVVTFEFDQWRSASGQPEKDRLDVLGLDRSGRLVVAELKRDTAPDTVEMQALKYAAMASRFTPAVLASQHSKFLSARGKPTTEPEALEALESHSKYGLLPENLAKPRIVLLASSFPPVVTATTVWLTEMSLDISLVTFQAYRADEMVIVTVSQLYPVADVEEFTVAPVRSAKSVSDQAEEFPEVPWTPEDLQRLRELASTTVLAVLDLCSTSPGEWVPLRKVEERAGRTPAQARADLAVLTMTLKRKFNRSNWPLAAEFGAGGGQQVYYRVDDDIAAAWTQAAADPVHQVVAIDQAPSHDGPGAISQQ